MTKRKEKSTKEQGANVQIENEVQNISVSSVYESVLKSFKGMTYDDMVRRENALAETYKKSTSEVKSAVSLYRKSLESAVSDIKTLYYGFEKSGKFGGLFGVDIDVKKHIDVLARLSGIDIEKLFDVKFVASLFDVYTFDVKDGGLQTLKAVKCRKTDKTDYVKVEASAEEVGFYINVANTEHTEKDKVYYWKPICNFTPNLVLKSVFALNKDSVFRIEREALKAAKKVLAKKAKKAAKKAEKAEVSTEVQTLETK